METENYRKEHTAKIILTAVILVAVVILLIILFTSTNKETKVVLTDTSYQVKGMFGTACDYDRITSIELKDTLPKVTSKNNGAAIGAVKKGTFTVEGLGECKLYLMSEEGPYLYILADNKYVIINYKDKAETEQLYADLHSKTGK